MKIKIKNGNIFCLESIWTKSIGYPRQSVVPLLNLLSMEWDITVSHFNCNTESELEYNINLANKKYGILYLAFHGEKGSIKLHEDSISLGKLAKMMGTNFKGCGVHFASCSTLSEEDSVLKKFIKDTGVSFISGYTKDVYWMPSAAIDLVYLDYLETYSGDVISAVNKMSTQIEISEKNIGFRYITK